MNFRSLLNFDKMITPVIIKILFYIGIIVSVIAGIVALFSGIIASFQQGGVGSAIGGLIGGPLIVVVGSNQEQNGRWKISQNNWGGGLITSTSAF